MNLHATVRGCIPAVNPDYAGQVRVSAGYTTDAAGKRAAAYDPPYDAVMQVQPLSTQDLRFLDGLNIQNSERAVYINGVVQGVSRPDVKGGDLLIFDSKLWLVTATIEPWNSAGWCKVGVTRQMPA